MMSCPLKPTVQLKRTLDFDLKCTLTLPIVIYVNHQKKNTDVIKRKLKK